MKRFILFVAAITLLASLTSSACSRSTLLATEGTGGSLSGGGGSGGTTSTVVNVGGAGGTQPPECVVYDSSAAVAPLDVFVLLDTSGSMLFSDGGATKWDAMKAALAAFGTAPESAGIGVAMTFFPIIDLTVPRLCDLNGSACSEWCKPFDWCWDILEACETTQDCIDSGSNETCSPFNVCSAAPEVFCQPGEIPCGSGLGSCVPGGSCNEFYTCSSSSYANPVFGPQKLPAAASGLAAVMDSQEPEGGTPTLPALTGVVAAATNHAMANPSHKVITLLATDGVPTVCDHDIDGGDPLAPINNLAEVAAAGAQNNIETFVIGVFTEEEAADAQANLDLLAKAGGTSGAFVISTDDPLFAELLEALNQVRAEAKSCEFELVGGGDPVDFNDVWVRITVGDDETWLSHVDSAAACDPLHGGFYYDVPNNSSTPPSRIILCPASCDVVDAAEDLTVELYTTCPDPMDDD